MSFVVSSIVEVSMNNVILWICVRIYDWTAESAKLVKMMETIHSTQNVNGSKTYNKNKKDSVN